MDTISSSNSLVIWNHNENGSGIKASCFKGDVLFLRDNYANVFSKVSSMLKEKNRNSFVKNVWKPTCLDECTVVFKKIMNAIPRASNEDVNKVVNKFRGNLGEILVEMLALNGLLEFIDFGTYDTVDPEHEQFVDAEALRNGLPIGIQVKNYHESLVGHEVLTKAAAMSDLWLRHDRKVPDDKILDFLKSPCQYVVSMTDIKTDMLTERYMSSVVFLGPSWFDLKGIQGSTSTGENAKWKMFEDVAEEIKNFELKG